MKITDIKVSLLDIPYPVPLRMAPTPDVELKSQLTTLVQIYTDEGIMGVGASGRDEARVVETQVKPYLLNQDPLQLEKRKYAVRAAQAWLVDIALCDIVGKAAGLPLYKLWGACQDRIKAYASGPSKRPPEAVAEGAQRFVEQGFKAIKLRAHNWTVKEDVALVEMVRNAVGDHMEIMVDANQAAIPYRPNPIGPFWDVKRALDTAKAFHELGVVWLEEPLGRYQYRNLARLTQESDLLIAGGEGNIGIHEFRDLLEIGAYDILQPDPTLSEGLSQMRKIAAAAEMHDRLFIPHHGYSGIGLAANLQLCGALPNSPWLEYMIDPPYRTVETYQQLCGVIKEPLLIDKEGYVPVPQKPGLGVEIDEKVVAKYRG
ncbi:MAG: mandelate racemase/muconate lactonizing enzyme family protein [Chloroflexi bacterium]|nr:mandelate racemase/muconate lactonizing enzyme family protein [Chloroflexota bacterium]